MTPQGLSNTKRRLFEALGRGEIEKAGWQPSLKPRNRREPAPLSLTQEQLWRLETETPGIPPLYNESITIRRKGALDQRLLERSLAEIVRRHEIWRTSYQTVNGTPQQVIHAAQDQFPLQAIDIRDVQPADRESFMLSPAQQQAQTRFDLQNGPLLRATLVRLSDAESRIVMTIHQSIIDGISVYQLLPSELSAIYRAFESGQNSPLPELAIQFSDFAAWHRNYVQGGMWQEQVGFWRRKLSGDIPALDWPKHRRPEQPSHRGKIRSFTLATPAACGARMLSRSERTSL